MAEYPQSKVLVDPEWVAERLNNPSVRLVRADRNIDPLKSPSIPASVLWRWDTEMQQAGRHDIPDKNAFQELLSRSGISNGTTVVLYGGANNWYAAFAFWLLKIYGHEEIRVMHGGMQRWAGGNRPVATDTLSPSAASYHAGTPDWSIRAFRGEVEAAIETGNKLVVDVRSPPEFKGEVFAPQTPPKFGERAGHIPGAVHVPCTSAVNEDGTFKTADELQAQFTAQGVTPDKEVITYCTLGARSAQSWFVLSQLLGYPGVQLYDGSWGEWGNLIGAPIES
ncbi:MAG: sulfurtransferase [SAR324 cluster bacterium]|nr:sulfurtransferase [SAR324 cluster bacterium]